MHFLFWHSQWNLVVWQAVSWPRPQQAVPGGVVALKEYLQKKKKEQVKPPNTDAFICHFLHIVKEGTIVRERINAGTRKKKKSIIQADFSYKNQIFFWELCRAVLDMH